jgi:uncharacterized protein (TIGR02145 family)
MYDGNSLKKEGQGTGFGSGTNTSGFSILLGGFHKYDGTFQDLGYEAYYPFDEKFVNIIYSNSSAIGWVMDSNEGFGGSLRCVRDDIGQLALKSPAGGENWQIGTTKKIKWTLSEVVNIRIDYTTNNGTSWINIIPSYPTSLGSYNWTIPNAPSTNCRVKITSTNSSDTNSTSGIFNIYQVPINPCPGVPTVTYAGQTYNTIAIGEQCWMRENLNLGAMINVTGDQSNNGIREKYCYNNDTNNCSIYGGLYQWNEAMQYSTLDGAQGICPADWHIPTWSDLSLLKSFVNNNSNSLKELGQGTGSGAGTNSSGFSALLAGISYQGLFYYLNIGGDWWTSTIYDVTNAYNLQVAASTNIIQGHPVDNMLGYSIRCINDLTVSELPVELTSFTTSILENSVILNWETATEINTSSFEIQRRGKDISVWTKISSLQAAGNSSIKKNYCYIDKNIPSGNYFYQLKIVDLDGSFKYSDIVDVEVVPPVNYELLNAYPNPWNPTTTIRYQIPINVFVTIKVFDALGKEVITLVNEVKSAGRYEILFNGKDLSSGVYYYQMKASKYTKTKKIILVK